MKIDSNPLSNTTPFLPVRPTRNIGESVIAKIQAVPLAGAALIQGGVGLVCAMAKISFHSLNFSAEKKEGSTFGSRTIEIFKDAGQSFSPAKRTASAALACLGKDVTSTLQAAALTVATLGTGAVGIVYALAKIVFHSLNFSAEKKEGSTFGSRTIEIFKDAGQSFSPAKRTASAALACLGLKWDKGLQLTRIIDNDPGSYMFTSPKAYVKQLFIGGEFSESQENRYTRLVEIAISLTDRMTPEQKKEFQSLQAAEQSLDIPLTKDEDVKTRKIKDLPIINYKLTELIETINNSKDIDVGDNLTDIDDNDDVWSNDTGSRSSLTEAESENSENFNAGHASDTDPTKTHKNNE